MHICTQTHRNSRVTKKNFNAKKGVFVTVAAKEQEKRCLKNHIKKGKHIKALKTLLGENENNTNTNNNIQNINDNESSVNALKLDECIKKVESHGFLVVKPQIVDIKFRIIKQI